jgi:hypothetical protein
MTAAEIGRDPRVQARPGATTDSSRVHAHNPYRRQMNIP